MAKEKEMKLFTVKQHNPELYEKLVKGEITLTDAYNETKRIQLHLTEFRGTNTRKKEFSTDFQRIMRLHNPQPEEIVAELKKAFPLTWKEFIK